MRFGFGKQDITPRLGVELSGYSGYLNRYAAAVRDRLWARAMAVADAQRTAVIVSCDLLYVTAAITAEVRRRVRQELDLPEDAIMVHTTHTHSGPCMRTAYRNAYDAPYMELLPRRIARACIDAVRSLQEAEVLYAAVPCEGMGVNRVYDRFNHGRDAWRDDFRPAKPELTDTLCHVFKVAAAGRVLGFVSCFGCHNVVGGPGCTYIHGDYAGIATNDIEREHPGAVGLFLQGAEGDVNVAGCCFGNDEVLEALDVLSSRYRRAVRAGLDAAQSLPDGRVGAVRRSRAFTRRAVPLEELRERLAVEEAVIDAPQAVDADQSVRWAVLRALSLRSIIARVEAGASFANPTEVQGLRFGPVALLGGPFEIFQAVKNEVVAQARAPIALVLSVTNDEQGYAVDRTTAGNPKDYAAHTVPLWKHTLPYADIHGELAAALLELDGELERLTGGA